MIDDLPIDFHKDLGWYNRPNSSVISGGKTYSINSSGFRSNNVNSSQKHILILGDSVVYGQGVEDDETISHNLNKILKDLV